MFAPSIFFLVSLCCFLNVSAKHSLKRAIEGVDSKLISATVLDGLLKDLAELKTRMNTNEMKLAECKNNNAELLMYLDGNKEKTYSNSPVAVFNQQMTNRGVNSGELSTYTLESTAFTVGKGINQIALSFSHRLNNADGVALSATVTLSTDCNTILYSVTRIYAVNTFQTHTAQSFNLQTSVLAAKTEVKATVTIAIIASNSGYARLIVDDNDYITMTMFAMI